MAETADDIRQPPPYAACRCGRDLLWTWLPEPERWEAVNAATLRPHRARCVQRLRSETKTPEKTEDRDG